MTPVERESRIHGLAFDVYPEPGLAEPFEANITGGHVGLIFETVGYDIASREAFHRQNASIVGI